ncbi:MAG: amidohydrolase family protein [Acidobacteria bacterium]|nr:amidohydrolase family protein [Acidobacteriota bacterium]
MKRTRGLSLWGTVLALVFGGTVLCAQQAGEIILYNGKIVTVDDKSFTSQLGTVAQAMHVKDGKVLHVGNNQQIRAMAGPNTRLMDLKGRTVLPGLVTTHDHPFDWDNVNPWIVKHVISDDVVVTRFLDGTSEEKLLAFPKVLDEAVSKAKPGQWIYIVVLYGKHYESAPVANGNWGRWQVDSKVFDILDGKRIPKKMLDAMAPNNPVLLRDLFTSTQMNQRAIEKVQELWKDYPDNLRNCISEETGLGVSCGLVMRWAFADLMMKDRYDLVKEVYRLGLEWWAGYGNTTISSHCYNPRCLEVYNDLNRSGQMAARWHWGWSWRSNELLLESFTRNAAIAMRGYGSDYFWFGGISGGGGFGACTSAEHMNPQVLIPQGGVGCEADPNSPGYKAFYSYIKAGGRFAAHTVGDKGIDQLMDIIEKASAEAGMTPEQIRAKRHAFDHGSLAPRPDQLERIKKLGLIASEAPMEIYLSAPGVFAALGERAVGYMVPKKRVVDAGIVNTFEFDRALGSTDLTAFDVMYMQISRKAWDGKVYAPDQKVSREVQLKAATTWGSYYVLRENVLGSLEPGKWADFMVIDRDYLTIPEDDIPNIRVLMSMVGGKVVHLVPSLARELGRQPAGAQVTLGFNPSKW